MPQRARFVSAGLAATLAMTAFGWTTAAFAASAVSKVPAIAKAQAGNGPSTSSGTSRYYNGAHEQWCSDFAK